MKTKLADGAVDARQFPTPIAWANTKSAIKWMTKESTHVFDCVEMAGMRNSPQLKMGFQDFALKESQNAICSKRTIIWILKILLSSFYKRKIFL
jgi:hypothetical protein